MQLMISAGFILAVALWRSVRQDWHGAQRRDKALPQRMRELVEHLS